MKPEILFAEVSKFVTDSRAALEKGAIVELAGLDKQVTRLCKETLMLSQEDRLVYAGRLQQVLADLTALGHELMEKRDQVADEIGQVSQHKKANVAYRKTEASDGGEE